MFTDDFEFEREIRRIGRLLWPRAEGGASIEDGKERDAIFEADEFVHVIECTTSRTKQKAEEDLEKIQKLVKRLGARHPTKFVKGWFITSDDPTPDQRSVFQKVQGRVVISSFDQFRARLVDAMTYLGLRQEYAFGSVRDPATGRSTTAFDYVTLDILDVDGQVHDASDLGIALEIGAHLVILGDYGTGKSATMREIYRLLARRFRSHKSLRFPVVLNLRDHHGQTDPVEALERHARKIGFAPAESLVRGWRAGLVSLLLDGFDEIATAGWAGKTKQLKDLRYRSMELIRAFIRDTPQVAGMAIAGREHFFDSQKEMGVALGIGTEFARYNLVEFSDQQVAVFLGRAGFEEAIPSWVPSRPLLLSYLASRNLLQETLAVEAGSGPAAGWNALLERISVREAEIEAGIDPGTVRRLIEHLGTLARNSADGLGPISADAITGGFAAVCGYAPDDRGVVLLQRLPGLGGHSAEDGSRVFIDKDFAAAAQGGEIFSYIDSPFSVKVDSESWQTSLSELGVEVAAERAVAAGFSRAKVVAAFTRVAQQGRKDTLLADIFLILNQMAGSFTEDTVFIKDAVVPSLELSGDVDFRAVEFQDCIFSHLDFEVPGERSPRFLRCYFGRIEGRTGLLDLPDGVFVDPVVEGFENPGDTTNAILELSLPLSTKVVLTALKKLYAQAGSGRREIAFFKGLDPKAQRLVAGALGLLRQRGFAVRTTQGAQTVWLPVKTSDIRRRAHGMLASPHISTDRLLEESKNLA